METDLITVAEAATRFCLSEQQVRNLAREGKLPSRRYGKQWLIEASPNVSEVNDYQLALYGDKPCTLNAPAANAPVLLSFFSGAMGLDLGLAEAGLHTRLACETDKACRRTILANEPHIAVAGDVSRYNPEKLYHLAGTDRIDVMAGGPPCQAFSTAGSRKGFEDARGNVFLTYINLAMAIRPHYLVIENVRGLLSSPLHPDTPGPWAGYLPEGWAGMPGSAFYAITRHLRENGYTCQYELYNAANFGTPQVRERVVLIATRSETPVPFLNPTHSDDPKWGLPPWRTLGEAIHGLNPAEAQHVPFAAKRQAYFQHIPPGGYWKDLPKELQPTAMGKAYHLGGGKTGFFRRLALHRPAPTLVTHPAMPATDLCHPTEDRPLSIQEYKRIQQFPDTWAIQGTLVEQYRQVGNAVPVGLGRAIGRCIMAHRAGTPETPPPGFKYSRYANCGSETWEDFFGFQCRKALQNLTRHFA